MRAWEALKRTAGMVCAVGLLCVAWSAAPASAHLYYTYTGSFGTSGSAGGDLASPQSVAVDQETGDVYVADTQNFRVEEFDSSGTFMLMFGEDVDETTGGNVCTAASKDTCKQGEQGAGG